MALTFWPEQSVAQFAKKPNVATAVTFYIVTVGIANYLIYGWLKLSLFERISDLLVHAVTPVSTLSYWFFFVEKTQLQYADLCRVHNVSWEMDEILPLRIYKCSSARP